ncbi:MAG: anaerobic ribonucleoside-triphosphate reductase, partial [Butyricicoccus sp.]
EDNVAPGAEYYYLTELAAKCTAKRMVPDYISEKKMKELKEGNCFPVMGCRSALSPWKDENGNYKFYGRFNQGVVTLNLVDVALSSGGDMDRFWKIFDERLDLCYRALMCRHNRLKGTLSDAAPILWQYGAIARLKKGEPIDKLLYGGYSTISLGYAGLCECVRYMTGKSHTDPSATPFALAVMKYMNTACERWKAETTIGFGIYGTPLESTTYKFAKCLQKRFGIVPGVTDKPYITNSYHVHVTEEIDAFAKLAFEAQFQALSTGGAISYVEVPNMQQNLEAVLQIIRYIYDNIMYAELNTKSDYCQACGLTARSASWRLTASRLGMPELRQPRSGHDERCPSAARLHRHAVLESGRTAEIKERVLHLYGGPARYGRQQKPKTKKSSAGRQKPGGGSFHNGGEKGEVEKSRNGYCGTGLACGFRCSSRLHALQNCFNAETWSFTYGKPFTAETEQEIRHAPRRLHQR